MLLVIKIYFFPFILFLTLGKPKKAKCISWCVSKNVNDSTYLPSNVSNYFPNFTKAHNYHSKIILIFVIFFGQVTVNIQTIELLWLFKYIFFLFVLFVFSL